MGGIKQKSKNIKQEKEEEEDAKIVIFERKVWKKAIC